jgi:hypothetical protein
MPILADMYKQEGEYVAEWLCQIQMQLDELILIS